MTRCLHRPAVLACSALLAALAAGIAAAPVFAGPEVRLSPPQKITTVEGITEYRLGNGLKVLLFPDPSKPTVTVNVTYFVGSRHEGYGETGMAHLLEHMVFKGTPKFPKVWESLQQHGAQFNGTTWYDRTNYFETLASTDENINFALELEADRMVNSFIAKKDLESEFSVVRNEFEAGENNPIGVLMERMTSTAYLWHNYGKSTIGSREDIERVPIERLQAFYRKYYQPDNAMLVVAGKFDPDKALTRINALFGAIPKPDRVLEPTYTVEPAQDGEREVVLRRVGDVQAIGCVYHICNGGHDDMPALEVLEDALTTDQTGRLYKALVETHLATSVSGAAFPLNEPGYMQIIAEVRTDRPLDEVRKVMLGVLDGLANERFTDEEVERAKNRYARDFDLLINDSGRVGVRLSEFAAMGDWRLMFLFRDRMKKVTPSDVQRVASTYFKPSNRTVGLFIPTKTPDRTTVPPPPDLVALLKDYRGSEEVAQGEDFEATPAHIESRTQRARMPFGLKSALLSKKTRGRKVNLTLTLRYGNEKELTGRTDAVDFIGPMLNKGTSKHTRRQIKDQFDKLKAAVNFGGGGPGGGPGVLSVSIQTVRKNLPATLELVAECLRDSTFPEKEFEKLRKETLTGLEQQLSEPMALAMVEMRRRLTPYPPQDVRYVPSLTEQIDRVKAVKLDDVKKAHAEFLGAGNAELAVVGDFDVSEIRSLTEHLLKGWNSPVSFERIAMPYKPVKPDVKVMNTPDKTNSLFAMGTTLEIRDDDPDYPALMMGNYLLGGNPNSRMFNRLRQKEGLSYGCGSQVQAGSLDRSGVFIAFGICAPQNCEKAVTCAREEIERLLKEGITQKELDEGRKGYFEQFKVRLSNDGMVAGMLARQEYLGRTMKFTEDELEKIRRLTADDVNKVLRKYLSVDKLFVIRAGDFEKHAGSRDEPKKSGDDETRGGRPEGYRKAG